MEKYQLAKQNFINGFKSLSDGGKTSVVDEITSVMRWNIAPGKKASSNAPQLHSLLSYLELLVAHSISLVYSGVTTNITRLPEILKTIIQFPSSSSSKSPSSSNFKDNVDHFFAPRAAALCVSLGVLNEKDEIVTKACESIGKGKVIEHYLLDIELMKRVKNEEEEERRNWGMALDMISTAGGTPRIEPSSAPSRSPSRQRVTQTPDRTDDPEFSTDRRNFPTPHSTTSATSLVDENYEFPSAADGGGSGSRTPTGKLNITSRQEDDLDFESNAPSGDETEDETERLRLDRDITDTFSVVDGLTTSFGRPGSSIAAFEMAMGKDAKKKSKNTLATGATGSGGGGSSSKRRKRESTESRNQEEDEDRTEKVNRRRARDDYVLRLVKQKEKRQREEELHHQLPEARRVSKGRAASSSRQDPQEKGKSTERRRPTKPTRPRLDRSPARSFDASHASSAAASYPSPSHAGSDAEDDGISSRVPQNFSTPPPVTVPPPVYPAYPYHPPYSYPPGATQESAGLAYLAQNPALYGGELTDFEINEMQRRGETGGFNPMGPSSHPTPPSSQERDPYMISAGTDGSDSRPTRGVKRRASNEQPRVEPGLMPSNQMAVGGSGTGASKNNNNQEQGYPGYKYETDLFSIDDFMVKTKKWDEERQRRAKAREDWKASSRFQELDDEGNPISPTSSTKDGPPPPMPPCPGSGPDGAAMWRMGGGFNLLSEVRDEIDPMSEGPQGMEGSTMDAGGGPSLASRVAGVMGRWAAAKNFNTTGTAYQPPVVDPTYSNPMGPPPAPAMAAPTQTHAQTQPQDRRSKKTKTSIHQDVTHTYNFGAVDPGYDIYTGMAEDDHYPLNTNNNVGSSSASSSRRTSRKRHHDAVDLDEDRYSDLASTVRGDGGLGQFSRISPTNDTITTDIARLAGVADREINAGMMNSATHTVGTTSSDRKAPSTRPSRRARGGRPLRGSSAAAYPASMVDRSRQETNGTLGSLLGKFQSQGLDLGHGYGYGYGQPTASSERQQHQPSGPVDGGPQRREEQELREEGYHDPRLSGYLQSEHNRRGSNRSAANLNLTREER